MLSRIALMTDRLLMRARGLLLRVALGRPYQAADRNRLNGDWTLNNQSADQALLHDEPYIRARARDAVRNDWLGASLVDGDRRDVVHTSIWPRANARDGEGNPRKAFNERATKRFRRWATNKDLIDVAGEMTLRQMLVQAQQDKRTVGNAFIVYSIIPRYSATSISLQMFEADQLANPIDCTPHKGNEVRAGVEIDPSGRKVAYWIHTRGHPMETWDRAENKPTRIPADRVFHLRHRRRVRETIGPSRLTPVLPKMWDRSTYDDNELKAKKKESFLGFAIKTNPEYGNGIPAFDPKTGALQSPGQSQSSTAPDTKYREMLFQQAMVPVLYPGEEIQFFNPDRPGANYDAYQGRQIGMIAAGAGRYYANVARDYSAGSYGSLRQGMLDDWRELDVEQLDLIEMILQPLWRLFIKLEVAEGKLSAPGFALDEEVAESYMECAWSLPKRDYLDPAKEAAADHLRLADKTITRNEIISQRGSTFQETADTINDERQYADSLEPPLRFPEDQEGGPKASPHQSKTHGSGEEATKQRSRAEIESLARAIITQALRDD